MFASLYGWRSGAGGGAWNPSRLSPLQWLKTFSTPKTAVDASANALDADYVASPALVLDGTDKITVAGLAGTETITCSGTSTPSAGVGEIAFTAGTCWNIVIDGTLTYPCQEKTGLTVYGVAGAVDGTIVPNALIATIRAGTQDEAHYSIEKGFSHTVTTAQSNMPSFCILGDSLTAQNGYGYEHVTAEGVGYANARGYFNWMRTYLSGQVFLNGNDGVGGETAAGILARVSDVTSKSPDFCIVCAGRNDVSQEQPLATTTANLTAINANLIAAGITPIWMTVTPSTGDTASKIQLRSDINDHIETFDNVSDSGAVIDDGAGQPITGANVDATHWSERGAEAIGRELSTLVESLCTPAPFEWHDTSHDCNAAVNPTFANDASGWAIAGSTAEYLDNNAVRLTATQDSAIALSYLENVSSGLFAVGDTLRCAIDVSWDSPAQVDDRYWHPDIFIRRRKTDNNFVTPVMYGLHMASGDKVAGMPTATSGRCTVLTPQFEVAADVNRLYIAIGFNAVPIGATVTIHRYSLWNVDDAATEDYPYVPRDESDTDYDVNGYPLTGQPCGSTRIHNGAPTSIKQKAANTEFLTNPFWSTDGVSYDAKSAADLFNRRNFENNAVVSATAIYDIKSVATWDSAYSFTEVEYNKVVAWLSQQGSSVNIAPFSNLDFSKSENSHHIVTIFN